MKVIDLLNLIKFDDMFKELKNFAPESKYESYFLAIEELKNIIPDDTVSEFDIYVHSEDGIEDDILVDALKKNDVETYGLDFISWNEILTMDIKTEDGLIINDAKLLAEILWEITFYGYSNKKIQEQGNELKERCAKISDEIKNREE